MEIKYEHEHEHFDCKCNSLDHTIRFSIFNWGLGNNADNYELMLSTHLTNSKSFWKRLKYGLSYIFRFQDTFGGWAETYIYPKDIPRLRKVLDEFENLTLKEN